MSAVASVVIPEQFPKRCRCCRAVHTELGWRKLHHLGTHACAGEVLQYRQCHCESTLCITLGSISDAAVSR